MCGTDPGNLHPPAHRPGHTSCPLTRHPTPLRRWRKFRRACVLLAPLSWKPNFLARLIRTLFVFPLFSPGPERESTLSTPPFQSRFFPVPLKCSSPIDITIARDPFPPAKHSFFHFSGIVTHPPPFRPASFHFLRQGFCPPSDLLIS